MRGAAASAVGAAASESVVLPFFREPPPEKLLIVLSAGAGYAFKHSKSQGRLPDWRLGACQLARALAPPQRRRLLAACGRLCEVGKRIVTATQVPQVASFGKASCSVAGIVSLTS